MKTKEELNALKEEVETLNKRLAELPATPLGGSNQIPAVSHPSTLNDKAKSASARF